MPGLFSASIENELCPGDVFRAGWDVDQAQSLGSIVVLSHGCDIDKSDTVLVSKVVSSQDTPRDLLGNLRAGRVWHGLYLDGSSEPGWANLRTIQPVEKAILLSRLNSRLHSMCEEGRQALAAKVYQYLTRTLPPSATS